MPDAKWIVGHNGRGTRPEDHRSAGFVLTVGRCVFDTVPLWGWQAETPERRAHQKTFDAHKYYKHGLKYSSSWSPLNELMWKAWAISHPAAKYLSAITQMTFSAWLTATPSVKADGTGLGGGINNTFQCLEEGLDIPSRLLPSLFERIVNILWKQEGVKKRGVLFGTCRGGFPREHTVSLSIGPRIHPHMPSSPSISSL